MGAFGNFLRSLTPGNDRELAATQYAGRESASGRAARKRREGHRRTGVNRAAQQGEQWERRDRRRFS
ncbi:hypothetical protein ACFVAF_36960 [Streptomyces sp. NPDC057596]|uniref:hypothetical protein n=1 Tax=Streptomyces sp. NPDC057596 TaxID=3346178 RepID=UPI0036B84487